MKADEEKADPATKTVLQAGGTERCLGKYFAPYVLHKIGKYVILGLYFVMVVIFIIGATQVRLHFEIDYFISESSVIFTYFQLNKKYYSTAGDETIQTYIDNANIDYSSEENQKKLNLFDQKLQDLKPCAESATCTTWMVDNTVTSWFKDFKQSVALGKDLACTLGNPNLLLEVVP